MGKIENKGFSQFSKEERKEIVLRGSGSTFERFVCPCCTLNRTIEPKEGKRIRFDKFDIDDGVIVHSVKTGGRGSGFFIEESLNKTLKDIRKDSAYDDLLEQIKDKSKELLVALK